MNINNPCAEIQMVMPTPSNLIKTRITTDYNTNVTKLNHYYVMSIAGETITYNDSDLDNPEFIQWLGEKVNKYHLKELELGFNIR